MPVPPPSPSSAAVLVVDDEELVRDVTTQVLERAGHTVLAAADGATGISHLEANLGRVALVVLDLTLPDMRGAEALQRLREIAPGVPVLVCSGRSEDEAREQLDDPPDAYLQKPFRPADLVAAVRRLLGG
jgi:CheY-like chemotaxis protein